MSLVSVGGNKMAIFRALFRYKKCEGPVMCNRLSSA